MKTHDEIVRELRAAVSRITLLQARDAFIASLGGAPLRYRSVLGHYAYAVNFPEHTFAPSLGGSAYRCRECGMSEHEEIDVNAHAQFQVKGDYSLADPVGAWLDLRDFEPVTPAAQDFETFDRMLSAAAAATRASAIVKAWSFVPRTNKYARDNLLATLGACGVFETLDHPGHLTRWVSFWEYEEVPGTAGDLRPPEAWWTSDDGINRGALDLVFRHPRVDRARFPKRSAKRPIPKATAKVGKLSVAPGDRVGIRYAGRHLVGVVLGAHAPKIPIIEMYAGSWAAWPTDAELAARGPRLVGPYYADPKVRREALAFDGLHLYGKVMGDASFEVLAHDCAPTAPGRPDGYRVIAPRNMLYILQTLAR